MKEGANSETLFWNVYKLATVYSKINDQATDNKIHEILSHFFAYSFHNLMIVLLSQQYKESNDFPISGVYSGFCYIKRLHWSDSLALLCH